MEANGQERRYRYHAFLSYSHAADRDLAPALQSALQKLANPWRRLRALRIFRDTTNLAANPALWPSIEKALSESKYFLLLASLQAASSQWVRREISWWLKHRSARTMLTLLTDGELTWDGTRKDFDWSKTTALSKELSGQFEDEPLHVDLRWAKYADNLSLRHRQFRDAVLDIATPLHGVEKDELDSEDVRQYRKTRRLAWSAGCLRISLLIVVSIVAYIAFQQRNRAQEQARIALSRQLAVQAREQFNDRLDVALLLGVEATRVADTFDGRKFSSTVCWIIWR